MPNEDMSYDDQRVLAFSRRPVGRRAVIRGGGLGLAGIAAAALIGCGGDDEDEPSAGGSATPGGDAGSTLTTTSPRPDQLPAGWVWAPDAPFPSDYPEPAGKTPKAGGVFHVAASWDVGPFDPIAAAAGGSLVVPNLVYNRLVGSPRGQGWTRASSRSSRSLRVTGSARRTA